VKDFKPVKIIVHCADTPDGKRVDVEEIRLWHTRPLPPRGVKVNHANRHKWGRGFRDIAYHYVIQPDGQIQLGRSLNLPGAHCQGENHSSIGVCLVGRRRFTMRQFVALRGLCAAVASKYDMEPTAVHGHREFISAVNQGKRCPHVEPEDLRAWVCEDSADALSRYLHTEGMDQTLP
jgi:N-acetylmuramoyl-L-alanine amidase